MDLQTQQICIEQINKFYKKNADSFSDTRSSAWDGWQRLLPFIKKMDRPLYLLDIGCGNLRFEKFLSENKVPTNSITAIDNCPALIPNDIANHINFIKEDIYQLISKEPICKYDFSVSFGVMHHIPDFSLRLEFLKYLIGSTVSNGIIAVSCWNFLESDKLKNKAKKTTEIAEKALNIKLDDKNDYFLNWQDDYTTFRYCHNFTEMECEQLAQKVSDSAELIDIYRADGKDINLNLYMVFKKL